MNCAWKELISILPPKLRHQTEVLGKEEGLELRLRLDKSPQLVRKRDTFRLEGKVTADDLHYVVNMACRYSPWTAGSASWGYITAPGGHRIGMCGEALLKDGKMEGIKTLNSLNIRIARDFPGIARALCGEGGSLLVIGRPGSGKTTLLRDLIRELSFRENISVVDERGELFPEEFQRGDRMDVLSGCSKPEGIDRVLRTMTPDTIAIDEITAEADTRALLQAAWCGVRLLATAHAANMEDLKSRESVPPLVGKQAVFHSDRYAAGQVLLCRKDGSMNYRIIGAILVIISTSTVGFSIAASHRKEASALMQLIRALEFMSCELEYRLPPLPELCRLTSMQITGPMKQVFAQLEQELQRQTSADAYCCMSAVLKKADKLPEASKRNLLLLGKNLGRFDVTGQLSGIASVIQLCRRDLDGLLSNQEVRLRSYRTLGICAGVALVILFI